MASSLVAVAFSFDTRAPARSSPLSRRPGRHPVLTG